MRHSVNPRQGRLFDPFEGMIPPLGLDRIHKGWQGIFRATLLELMPARRLGKHFSATIGRPTKELFSVAGLLFLQEFHNWTVPDAVEAYLFRTDIQFALNLEPGRDEMCERTLERYRALFLEDEGAGQVMQDVTDRLVDLLELDIAKQRLDSTHVFSNMASFGRTRLMAVTIKRFLFLRPSAHLVYSCVFPRVEDSQPGLSSCPGSSCRPLPLAGWLATGSRCPGLLPGLPVAVKTPFHAPIFPDGVACTGVLYHDSGIAPARLLIGTSRALEGDPSSWLNHAFHGGALFRNGEHANAVAELNEAVKLHGKPSPLTHCLLALTYLHIGEKAKARDALAQSLPAKDAPWEEVFLHRLFQPEIDTALAKADGKRDLKEK